MRGIVSYKKMKAKISMMEEPERVAEKIRLNYFFDNFIDDAEEMIKMMIEDFEILKES